MSVTKTRTQGRHLNVVSNPAGIRADVAAVQRGLEDVTRLIRHYYGLDDRPSPEVLEQIRELDAVHQTACDVYDLGGRAEHLEASRPPSTVLSPSQVVTMPCTIGRLLLPAACQAINR